MENSVKNVKGHEMKQNESRESNCSKPSCETSITEVSAKWSYSPSLLGWPLRKASKLSKTIISNENEEEEKSHVVKPRFEKPGGAKASEVDMMKERFAKLLLGEDMSGSGKGVCSALAISNAITNLCATIFGQLWRLEPLPAEKKSMWRREMDCLLSVSNHIVELIPSLQTFADGSKMEVMTCTPRSDLSINLPALRKLDTIILDILDSFTGKEFCYVEQGIIPPDTDGADSFHQTIHRQEQQWWLPVPRVPPYGLTENTRRQLLHSRECTSQILKAAMAINNIAIAEMDVPESYLETLQKNGRACLGDVFYRHITSDKCSPDNLLDCLNLSSEHAALDVANRLEASIYVWRRNKHFKPSTHPNCTTSKSSWEMVKGLVAVDGDRRDFLAERAEKILVCLKQRFPNLTQTTLDATKIQCNKDVGKSILESYSRVLESLAFNIVARIDDIIYADDLTRKSDKLTSVPVKRNSFSYSASNAASYSPLPLISPARSEKTLILKKNEKPHRRGFGAKRVLANYLGVDTRSNTRGNPTDPISCSISNMKDNKSLGHQSKQVSKHPKTPFKKENFQDENQDCNRQYTTRRE